MLVTLGRIFDSQSDCRLAQIFRQTDGQPRAVHSSAFLNKGANRQSMIVYWQLIQKDCLPSTCIVGTVGSDLLALRLRNTRTAKLHGLQAICWLFCITSESSRSMARAVSEAASVQASKPFTVAFRSLLANRIRADFDNFVAFEQQQRIRFGRKFLRRFNIAISIAIANELTAQLKWGEVKASSDICDLL